MVVAIPIVAHSQAAQERQAIFSQLVLARGQRPPNRRRDGNGGILDRETLNVEGPGVAHFIQDLQEALPVRLVPTGRAAVVAADLHVHQMVSGGPDSRGHGRSSM